MIHLALFGFMIFFVDYAHTMALIDDDLAFHYILSYLLFEFLQSDIS